MITTRLTERLGITHPIISAPMALASGGALAAAVTRAGGLGLIGGAYCDENWIKEQFALSEGQNVGCGFISWALAEKPGLLETVLDLKPSAIFLSFADPQPFIPMIKSAGIPVICQVQTLKDAEHAIDVGADIIVAQGSEAGGHGEKRATFTFVPEVADLIARTAPDVLLCAAGGVGDGRGLAAAMMLGADGVVVGSRLWAAQEALVHPHMHQAAIDSTGDTTIRSTVMDIARRLNWPERYTARVLQNGFTERWHGNESGLLEVAERESAKWIAAFKAGDTDIGNTFVGEVTGLIHSIESAGDIITNMVVDAEELLDRSAISFST